MPFPALLTVSTRVRNPFDPNPLSHLDWASLQYRPRTNGYNLANSFMTTDERRYGLDGPVAKCCVQVSVAHTGASHLDEAFVWLQVGNGLDWMFEGDADFGASRVYYSHLLGSGDVDHDFVE